MNEYRDKVIDAKNKVMDAKDKVMNVKDMYLEIERMMLTGTKGKAISALWFFLAFLYFGWVILITY